jgi:SAM-dependent methyltransferase
MEKQYVHNVYDVIYKHFDDSRYNVWNCVRSFLDSLAPHSFVLDAGCGNGKNMMYRSDLVHIGFDTCLGLLKSSRQNGSMVVQSNGLSSSFRPNTFDAVICIAVIHHISTSEDRLRFLRSLANALQPGGKALITVWAQEQDKKKKWIPLEGSVGDYLIPWDNRDDGQTYYRYYHLFRKEEVYIMCASLDDILHVQNVEFEKDNWCIVLVKRNLG